MKIPRFLIAVTVLFGILMTLAVGFQQGLWRIAHPSRETFPIWGIDVSHHQGRIDWEAVGATGQVQFAYIKATEGGDYTDPRFLENWKNAQRAGIRTGAYHFLTFCRSSSEQAKHFLSVLPREKDSLPPVVDLEFGGNCQAHGKTPEQIRAELRNWIAQVEHATARQVIIYATREAADAFLNDGEFQNPLWMRSLLAEPKHVAGRSWLFWQFADRDRIDGISGPVDRNVFAQDANAFHSMLSKMPVTD